MGMEEKTHFKLDKEKCIGCGNCVNVCTGMVLSMQDGHPEMKPFERFGWRGCWRCDHCIAVCPSGAISIFDKKPENMPEKPMEGLGAEMAKLVSYRRSCRRFQDRNVDAKIIDEMLSSMENAPTGGNSCNVEYTVIDDKTRVREIWNAAYPVMDADAKKHIYTHSFSDFFYSKMKQSEKTVRKGDLLFCSAPHLFIAHEKCVGKWAEDSKANCIVATTYFELLCNAYGLGTTIMSYPSEVLNELALCLPLRNREVDHVKNILTGLSMK